MVAKARTFTYEAAISSAGYDSRARLQMEERLRSRLRTAASAPPLWTRAEREGVEGDGSGEILGRGARVVIVLHQRMWGRTPATRGDVAAIERRLSTSGGNFLQVVRLDRSLPPTWLGDAPSCSVLDHGLDGCIDRIIDTVSQRGGATRPAVEADVVARAAADEQAAKVREAFLASHRARSALTRELDVLTDQVERRALEIDTGAVGVKAEVRRIPGRCIVQLGPVAMSLSWISSRVDPVAEGRLMVIEWDGTIGRGAEPNGGARAAPIREEVFRADATVPEDWRWRSDDTAVRAYGSRDLAALCVDSLECALRERGR